MNIADLHVTSLPVYPDRRGSFVRAFDVAEARKSGFELCQINQSRSAQYVFRGLHFQRPPYAQAKIVQVLAGAIIDFVLDLRTYSPTYQQMAAIRLAADSPQAQTPQSLFVPAGCAHGFVALLPDTHVQYYVDHVYAVDSELGVHYGAAGVLSHLPAEVSPTDLIISEKDTAWGDLSSVAGIFTSPDLLRRGL